MSEELKPVEEIKMVDSRLVKTSESSKKLSKTAAGVVLPFVVTTSGLAIYMATKGRIKFNETLQYNLPVAHEFTTKLWFFTTFVYLVLFIVSVFLEDDSAHMPMYMVGTASVLLTAIVCKYGVYEKIPSEPVITPPFEYPAPQEPDV
jgi:phosphatidylglycerophosphate synthase